VRSGGRATDERGGAVADGAVTLHALPESRLIRTIKAHVQPAAQLAFLPDGTRLASSIESTVDPSIFDTAEKAIDATGPVRVWDLQTGKRLANVCRGSRSAGPTATWRRLGDEDARAAYRAVGALAANPGAALPFLRGKLQAVAESACRPVRRLIDDLDSDDFTVRQRATDLLQKLPGEWEFLLRQELDAKPSLEVARRLETILSRKQPPDVSPDMRRRLNAMWALEEIGSKEARDVVERLARGVAGSPLTRQAAEALRRWMR
jgi:hypothetical protein